MNAVVRELHELAPVGAEVWPNWRVVAHEDDYLSPRMVEPGAAVIEYVGGDANDYAWDAAPGWHNRITLASNRSDLRQLYELEAVITSWVRRDGAS